MKAALWMAAVHMIEFCVCFSVTIVLLIEFMSPSCVLAGVETTAVELMIKREVLVMDVSV
jgi:hypothetical protein